MWRNQVTLIHSDAGRWPLSLFSTIPITPLCIFLCLPPRLFISFFPPLFPSASLLGGTVHGPVQEGGGLINPTLMAN